MEVKSSGYEKFGLSKFCLGNNLGRESFSYEKLWFFIEKFWKSRVRVMKSLGPQKL